ncbi:MAG: ElyC/SanA/YdcF family protein [Verrucomicrobiota bacterium]
MRIEMMEEPRRSGGAWRLVKFLFKAGLWALVLVGLVTLFCNLWVVGSTHDAVYTEIEDLDGNEVGLVLGTSPKVAPTTPNLHFKGRVEAAAALYDEGKVKVLLVSGANPDDYYNEPKVMTEALVKLGVPKSSIRSDFAGLRTLDSVVRAKKIFGQDRITIISDDFHVPRAVFLARQNGIDAVGLAGERVSLDMSYKTRVREWLARVKAVLDVYVLGTEPKFLGEPEEIDVEVEVAEPEEVEEEKSAAWAEPESEPVKADARAVGMRTDGLWDRLNLHVDCPCHTTPEAL